MGSGNTVNDFKPGDSVVYIPTHLQKELDLSKGEYGTVKRCTDTTVFVNYVIRGVQQETAQGTSPGDLWHN